MQAGCLVLAFGQALHVVKRVPMHLTAGPRFQSAPPGPAPSSLPTTTPTAPPRPAPPPARPKALLPVPPPGELPPRLAALWAATPGFSPRAWPSLFTVRALSGCTLLVLDGAAFADLLEEYPWVRFSHLGPFFSFPLSLFPPSLFPRSRRDFDAPRARRPECGAAGFYGRAAASLPCFGGEKPRPASRPARAM
jgi:hypothetical protein